MSATSFVIDKVTAEAIEELKTEFGVSTNAAVIRKAIALARVAARSADGGHAITLLGNDGIETKILLTG